MRIAEEEVGFPGGEGGDAVGRVVRPEGAGPWPAVVVVPEAEAPRDRERALLRRIAQEGFVALGAAARGPRTPAAAVGILRGRPEVRAAGVGVVGFGAGGTAAFHLALDPAAPVGACVDFYGPLRGEAGDCLGRARDLRCPLLGVFGGSDDRIPLREVLSLKEALGGRSFVIAYPRAGHGFMDAADPAHREEDARDAWRRTFLFLREHLAPDTLPPDAGPAVPEFRPAPDRRRS